MQIDKELIITCGMIVMLCFAFFWIGYGYAVKKEANFANEFIADYQRTHICTEIEEPEYGKIINIRFEMGLNASENT